MVLNLVSELGRPIGSACPVRTLVLPASRECNPADFRANDQGLPRGKDLDAISFRHMRAAVRW